MPKCTVIAFPGNNCETETVRAAERNGFETNLLRWNQTEQIGDADLYILPGGFSFEDRGRSGSIAAREPIFDSLRQEAEKGKLILGICNGAQMVVESGLIPVEGRGLPFGLAENVRRDENDHVIGTGYYNTWINLKAERTDTAFTQNIDGLIHVPIAHGEGRFTSTSEAGNKALESGSHVAFRYADEDGNISDKYPVTPNGSNFATAAITNVEGTIMAIMPHPERFYKNFTGDQILASAHSWITEGKSPDSVVIGDLSAQPLPEVKKLENNNAHWFEKQLIITDNECFSVASTASNIAGKDLPCKKSIVFSISGDLDAAALDKIENSGLVFNPNKETWDGFEPKPNQVLVHAFEDDEAEHLSDKISDLLGSKVQVSLYKAWDFVEDDTASIEKILQNGLLSNPNFSEVYMAYPDFAQ